MRLHDFVPIEDDEVDGESLIDAVFGPAFCVVDEFGTLLTTAYNRALLHRAQQLCARAGGTREGAVAFALEQLALGAEALEQEHYDRAVSLEFASVEHDRAFDQSLVAGKLD